METLNGINKQLANYHRISTIVIDKINWSEANRLLTPTMKVRRAALDQSYGEEYEQWHQAKEVVVWK